MHEPWEGVLATDSQGVIDTLQEGDRDLQDQEVPIDLDRGNVILDCLRPDWDILIEIPSALKQMPRVTLQYVRGHQDDTTPYCALDIMGQLNVNADKQAGLFNQLYGAYHGSVPISPLARAHLQLPEGTITSRYSEVLLHEATAKPLLAYLKRKNRWNTPTLRSIHWEAHAHALNSTTNPHTHMVKFLHKMLPTHAQANKFDGGTRKCPLCGSLHKDFFHIISCEHPSRVQWRTTFLTELRDLHIQTNTSPQFCGRLWLIQCPPGCTNGSWIRRHNCVGQSKIGCIVVLEVCDEVIHQLPPMLLSTLFSARSIGCVLHRIARKRSSKRCFNIPVSPK
jgi:hypothetical protein